MDADSVVLDG